MYCSRRSSTSSCRIFKYLYWFQCVTFSYILAISSSEKRRTSSARIGLVRRPWFNSYWEMRKSRRSISEKRLRKDSRTVGEASANASSRENVSFFVRNCVVPNADSEASLKVGYSIRASKDSTGESSQVPCLDLRPRPICLPFLPVTGSFPQRR